eukprot:3814287-Rhodomonas_salina.1
MYFCTRCASTSTTHEKDTATTHEKDIQQLMEEYTYLKSTNTDPQTWKPRLRKLHNYLQNKYVQERTHNDLYAGVWEFKFPNEPLPHDSRAMKPVVQ